MEAPCGWTDNQSSPETKVDNMLCLTKMADSLLYFLLFFFFQKVHDLISFYSDKSGQRVPDALANYGHLIYAMMSGGQQVLIKY